MTLHDVSIDTIDTDKTGSNKKFDLYKVFWMFFIGSVLGCLIEAIWFLIYHNSLEYRSSLIFFPFTLIYGVGALVLYLGLHKIKRKKLLHIFIFGVVASTILEYSFSLLQEMLLGSVSWSYSDSTFFNIGGRISLSMSFAWGLLSILWVIAIQPWFEKLISKIPTQVNKPLTWGLMVFLAINAVISLAAVTRWGMRLDGIPPANIIAATLDKLFPNELMTKFYPSMIWIGK